MIKIVFFLIGFLLSVIGFVYIIAYLNYLSIGYGFLKYLKMIFTRIECIIGFIGLIIIGFIIFKKGEKYDICV